MKKFTAALTAVLVALMLFSNVARADAAKAAKTWEEKADEIIAHGLTFSGVPYVYGGDYDQDKTAGFDCSGFVARVYGDQGIRITRQSAQSAKRDGVTVTKAQLRKGDLVYTDTNLDGVVNHISIYIGEGKLLHTYGTGGVRVSMFTGSNWERTFVTAKRVIK